MVRHTLTPYGKRTDEKAEERHNKIDLNKPVTIRLVKAKENRIFQF